MIDFRYGQHTQKKEPSDVDDDEENQRRRLVNYSVVRPPRIFIRSPLGLARSVQLLFGFVIHFN